MDEAKIQSMTAEEIIEDVWREIRDRSSKALGWLHLLTEVELSDDKKEETLSNIKAEVSMIYDTNHQLIIWLQKDK